MSKAAAPVLSTIGCGVKLAKVEMRRAPSQPMRPTVGEWQSPCLLRARATPLMRRKPASVRNVEPRQDARIQCLRTAHGIRRLCF
jgi:hypothetical protein